jgi:glycosyltransferase involved in cell wall biosynthesis
MNSGINPSKIYAIPNGYNQNIFNTKTITRSKPKKFLYVGCHQYRKGVDVLLRAWISITKDTDDVELIIKDTPQVYGTSNLQNDIINLQYKYKCGKITYIDTSFSEQEMAELYKSCHYLVHPYRGEGFGMHILEAEQCGVTTIVTAGGPTDEFATGYRINSTKQVVNMYEIFALKPGDSMTLMGQHKWVLEPDVNHLAQILKECIDSKKGPPIVESKKANWSEVANMYSNTLADILKKPITRK